jgi:type II secretory pathway pseudopilin PulG
MLLVVMLFGMAAALLVYGMVDTSSLALRRDKDTAAALAQAKQALIGRAASDDNRPGSLPCPDTDNDGSAELFVGNDCPSYIGRLPWKTLGLPDLRDGDGERLWYALSNNFRDHGSAEPINSDTKGNQTVYHGSTALVFTAEAVAVIFAPGASFGAQIRDAALALCPTTGTTIARNLCAANYLDATGGANNATTAGPYVTAQRSDTFNDQLLVITTAELMPLVEQRVATEVRSALLAYKDNSVCACYPWADISDGTSQTDLNRGRVPTTALPENWGTGTIPALPSWFVNNSWRLVIYYSVGRNFLQSGGGACTSCVDPTLTVNGVASKEAVIITPGPAGVSGAHTNWPFDYFEDAQNNDHSNDATGNDIYVTPSSTAYARDRLYIIRP